MPVLPDGQLSASFDERGVAKLSYGSVTLVDLDAGTGDPFLVGNYSLGGVAAYGGTGEAASWDAGSQTLTWSYGWGSVAAQYQIPAGVDELTVTLTVSNTSGQPIDGIDLFPLGLQFPALPAGWGSPNNPQFHNNLDGVDEIVADFGAGELLLVDEDAAPLYLGFSPSGPANHYELLTGTLNDPDESFLATAVPVSRPVPAGGAASYAIALRFAPSGAAPGPLASDITQRFAEAWPMALSWSDRRPLGELFLTNPTSAPIASTDPNPRNYNFTSNIDVQTPDGLAAFQAAALAYAAGAVARLQSMNAQGAIVWDLEGQQYPQPDTSYVGDPSLLPMMSPEMDGVADAFFKTFTDAGLRCGMTIRPEHLDLSVSPPNQVSVPVGGEAAVMIQKMSYAYQRWGCTIFYVDSDGGPDDATAPSAFAAVLSALPGLLILPENIWPKDYAYAAPLASFTAPYKPLHTPAAARLLWPNAFSVTYIGDAPGGDLTQNPADPQQWSEFVQAVAGGDILSFRAWFDDEPLNGQVQQIYQAAGVFTPAAPTCP